MKLVGSRNQQTRDFTFDASGTITTGGTAQLLLPERKSTSYLLIQNLSTGPLFIEFGSARATCTISGGAVNAITVTNGGFGFTRVPKVHFYGGGQQYQFNNVVNTALIPCGLLDYPSPSTPATALPVLTTGSVSSITILNGGAGYKVAPQVFIDNDVLDPFGCATPSATSGITLSASGGSYFENGTTATTDPIAIFGATTGQAFCAKWRP